MGLYSTVEPLQNDNGLVNKDNSYTVNLLVTGTAATEVKYDVGAGLVIMPVGATTIIRQGTRVTIAINATTDGFDITEMYSTANDAGSGWNAILGTEMHITTDVTGITAVTDRNGQAIDVMDVWTSLIIGSDEAGVFYLV